MKSWLHYLFYITFSFTCLVGFPRLSEAQTRTLRMPHDGYVCYKKTVVDCAASVLGSTGYATVFKSGIWEIRDGTLFLNDPILPYNRTKDEKIGCFKRYHPQIAYFELKFNRVHDFQVFSVEMFLRFSEAWIQFERAAKECQNVVNKAQRQTKAQLLQIPAVRSDRNHQELSAEMENFSARMSLLRDKNYCYTLPNDNLITRCLGEVKMPAIGNEVPGMSPLLLHNAVTSSRIKQASSQFEYRMYLLDEQDEEFAIESDRLTKNLEAAGVELARASAAISGAVVTLPEGAKIRKVLADEGIPLLKGDLVLEYRR